MRSFMLCIAGLGFAVASPAFALDPGECLTPEVLNVKMREEGQRSIAIADEISAENEMRALIFTVNADRSVGYVLRSNTHSDEKATQVCVHRRLSDVRIHDARRPGPSTAALLKASDMDAGRRCDEITAKAKIPRGACFSLNEKLREEETKGVRPILQGFVVRKYPDATLKPDGTLLTVSGNIIRRRSGDDPLRSVRGHLLDTAMPEGATYIDTVMVYPYYTPHGLSLLPN